MRAIGPAFTDAERLAFIAEARSYIGVKFRHQGRSRLGVDCAGLVACCLSAIGRPFQDRKAYGREPLQQQLRAMVAINFGEPVPLVDARPCDIALMRFRGEPSHVAILADYVYGGLSVVHSFAQVRKVVEHRLDSEWRGYITEVFRP